MKENIKFNHCTDIQMRFNDVDKLGHVNNAVYQHYFDLARVSYWDIMFEGKGQTFEPCGPVLVNIQINFYEQIRLSDKIHVVTKVSKIGNKSLEMYQQVRDENGRVFCDNTAVMVWFNLDTQESEVVPDLWRKTVNEFENK